MNSMTSLILAFLFLAIFGSTCRSVSRRLKKLNDGQQDQYLIWGLHGSIVVAVSALAIAIYFFVKMFLH